MTTSTKGSLSDHAARTVLGASASTIRKMFELAQQMRKESSQPVYDLSLGNPSLEPPTAWKAAMRQLLDDPTPGQHRYMLNAGFPEVRAFIAQREGRRYGLPFEVADVTMSCGAAAAVNTVFRAILNPGDQVIVPTPYFTEYDNYCDNAQAELVKVGSGENFALDIPAILAAARSPKARVVMLNSPNNPTGAIYSSAEVQALATGLREIAATRTRPLYVIEDSPYRDLTFDGSDVPSILPFYPETIFLSSHSKDLGLAGERIGYCLVSPNCSGRVELSQALPFYTRTLGFVNAPALMQRTLPLVLGRPDGRVDVSVYARNCQRMADGLRQWGYKLSTPRAGFFLFPKIPATWASSSEGDVELAEALLRERVIVVPGRAFGGPGYLRLAMCVPPEVVDGALEAIARVHAAR